MRLKRGEMIQYDFQVTKAMVRKFAELSGDYQRLHTDEDFAKRTIFQKPIVHGLLTMLPLSKMLGTDVLEVDQGEYLIFARINRIEFLKPVYFGDSIILELTLTKRVRNKIFFRAVWKKGEDIVLRAKAMLVLKTVEAK